MKKILFLSLIIPALCLTNASLHAAAKKADESKKSVSATEWEKTEGQLNTWLKKKQFDKISVLVRESIVAKQDARMREWVRQEATESYHVPLMYWYVWSLFQSSIIPEPQSVHEILSWMIIAIAITVADTACCNMFSEKWISSAAPWALLAQNFGHRFIGLNRYVGGGVKWSRDVDFATTRAKALENFAAITIEEIPSPVWLCNIANTSKVSTWIDFLPPYIQTRAFFKKKAMIGIVNTIRIDKFQRIWQEINKADSWEKFFTIKWDEVFPKLALCRKPCDEDSGDDSDADVKNPVAALVTTMSSLTVTTPDPLVAVSVSSSSLSSGSSAASSTSPVGSDPSPAVPAKAAPAKGAPKSGSGVAAKTAGS